LLIALNNKGIRVRPIKGGLGKCQTCNNDVRAYCGEINIHHWRHIDSTECDSWKENETEWHREWKGIFPIDWQEVVINKNDQIHRADIKTPNGLVVEFQNSSISSTDVKKREHFYNNMIWLINAEKFKDNINLWSEVKAQLRYLERTNSSFDYDYYHSSDSDEVSSLKEDISEIKENITSNEYKRAQVKQLIGEIKELEGNIKQTTNSFFEGSFAYYGPMKNFKSKIKDSYLQLSDSMKGLLESFKQKKELLKKTETFVKCKTSGLEDYSIVEYKDISSKNYNICKMLQKETMNSFFPDIINFKFAQDFERMARNQNFILVMDFRIIIKKLESESQELNEDISKIKSQQKNQKRTLKNQISKFLKSKRNEAKSTLVELKENDIDLQNRLYHQKQELKEIKRQEKIVDITINARAAKEEEQRRYSIMKDYKGLYGYNWKYRRKTWDFANKPIYLDYGNSIFKMLSESRFKKISNLEFVNLVSDWKLD
jgi:hypothetical protein